MFVCVCVCVCVRERACVQERESACVCKRETVRDFNIQVKVAVPV